MMSTGLLMIAPAVVICTSSGINKVPNRSKDLSRRYTIGLLMNTRFMLRITRNHGSRITEINTDRQHQC